MDAKVFKVVDGTALYSVLMVLLKKIKDVKEKSKAIATELGAEGVADIDHRAAGGIKGFYFNEGSSDAKHKPGWKKLEAGYTNWFFPKSGDKSNKDLIARIDALPVVKYEEINLPLGYGDDLKVVSANGGIGVSHTPGITWGEGYVLITVPTGIKYRPVEGMIEITGSEYEILKNQIKK